jgi:primosomal protein N' (replication factor Y)
MREKVWRQVTEGRVSVVAGARSALFLPFADLGLIIVDEEHDPAYKQEDRVFYNARDMAVVRARLGDIPVVLASATPSIESRVNAAAGSLQPSALPGRYADAGLPDIEARRHAGAPAGARRVPVAAAAEGGGRDAGAQGAVALVSQPARLCAADAVPGLRPPVRVPGLLELAGRAPVPRRNCSATIAVTTSPCRRPARNAGRLTIWWPAGRGSSGSRKRPTSISPMRASSCCRRTWQGGTRRLRIELEAIAKGEADIVIGTQLVAKGHNFPLMTLVGVVDADLGLSNGDPRAAERTYQLLSQVTGRAGRSGRKSQGLIQTFQPQHPVMQALASGDPEAFYERETDERNGAVLPPFGRLASVIVSAATRPEAETHARGLRAAAPCRARHHGARARRSPAGADPRPAPLPAAGARRARQRHRRAGFVRQMLEGGASRGRGPKHFARLGAGGR